MIEGTRRRGWRRSLRRRVFYPFEALAARSAFAVFRALGVEAASNLGGRIARLAGPRLAPSRQAARNLRRAFPDKSDAEIDRIVRDMWDNLGRVIGEYPHTRDIDAYGDGRIEVIGAENIDELRDDGRPGLFFTAHFGNWEITPPIITQRGLPITIVYRAANNPAVDEVVRKARDCEGVEQVPKGPVGARRAIELLGNGGHLGLLVDQKMNDGIPIPFFGRDAMTAPALAQLALRYHCPVVPVRSERTRGTRFRVTFFPPLEAVDTGDRDADMAAFMTRVNAMIEGWVRERPEQWFWLHRRWED
ncbi:MAG: lipid A biosynthesis lauroyl acyltransferase [Alphaproteobacteria bacterium]